MELDELKSEALKEINKIRAALDLAPARKIEPGYCAKASMCPVANTIGSDVSVTPCNIRFFLPTMVAFVDKFDEAGYKPNTWSFGSFTISILDTSLAKFVKAFDNRLYPELTLPK